METFPHFTSCLNHLTTAHPEHAILLRDHGRRGFENMPITATLSKTDVPGSTQIFHCDCNIYFLSFNEALNHYKVARRHVWKSNQVIYDDGDHGFRKWVVDDACYYFSTAAAAAARPAVAAGPLVVARPVAAARPADVEAPNQYAVLLIRRANGESFSINFTADTIRGIAALLTVAGGPASDWLGMMTGGQIRVHFDQVDGRPSGIASLRTDENVRQLKACMAYGIVDLE